MKNRDVVAAIESRGGRKVRQVGSHARFTCPCEAHHTTVPMHKGEDIAPGTLRAIEKALESCEAFRRGWLR